MPRHAVSHVEWDLGSEILRPDSQIPLFIQVAYLAFGVIASRHMPEGSPLPSEPSLAARWGVARGVVHKAFAVLEEEGIIRSRARVGYFVAFEPDTRRVEIQPGTRVYARPPTPQERADLAAVPWGTPVLVCEEPGKHPAVRDAVSTIIYA